jgi:hypothetical protein
VCSLNYPAYKAHAPCYIVTRGPSDSTALFHIISYRTRISEKKVIENKMCVSYFSTNLSVKFLILRRPERDITKTYIGLHVKYPLFLSNFNET